ncbi:MAG: nucleotidyltransferase domain-containing protein [Acutalibacter muris]|jgi:predicted nucleotidyltransferase|nr:nucleotidyltransferase domain-containing protein [Acutalibacter muris]
MDYSLSKTLKAEIIDLARRCRLGKVILFGSRARGDNHERSDIDLAIQAGV